MDKDKVLKAIEELPICYDAKKGVRKILSEVTGVDLDSSVDLIGKVVTEWDNQIDRYYVIGTMNGCYVGISINNTKLGHDGSIQGMKSNKIWFLYDNSIVIANSLEEYYLPNRKGQSKC